MCMDFHVNTIEIQANRVGEGEGVDITFSPNMTHTHPSSQKLNQNGCTEIQIDKFAE